MENPIPKNTPENTVSGGSGKAMMVKLDGKGSRMGFWAELGCDNSGAKR
jgi:hypothetical protein